MPPATLPKEVIAIEKRKWNRKQLQEQTKRQRTKEKREPSIGTPYDDVFRTLLIDCSELILPVLNEAFGEHYTGAEEVTFAQNEHFPKRQDRKNEKRVTDSSFSVTGERTQKYLCECQSVADNTILVRIFEYAVQIAAEQRQLSGHRLKVQIPKCAVLFLRNRSTTPDSMEIELETPGGTVTFDVRVVKSQQYSLDQIFEKKLLFLIPFYIFNYERRFPEYNSSQELMRELKAEYVKIMDQLGRLSESGEITTYTQKAIVEMSTKVLESIARKYAHIRKGVGSVMGGRVLDYEAKRIRNKAFSDGRNEGFTAGKNKGLRETARRMYKKGMSIGQIAELVDCKAAVVEKWLGLVSV